MSLEMMTALSSAVISILTLCYTVAARRRQNILQSVTANRLDWIQKTREAIESFCRHYRNHDHEGMMDSEVRIELLMRRDYEEYRIVLDHLRHCITSEYNAHDYEKLLTISSWILARTWQRIRIDSEKSVFTNDTRANRMVTNQVKPLFDLVKSYDSQEDKSKQADN